MEYNYTKEFKQPHKIYGFGDRKIPFLSNGVRLEQIVVFGVFLLILGIFFL
ncbi:TcpE family conjugal transfer membrane protein, partial [Enterococcus hirae]